jgi:hypothetical protein
LLIRQWTVEIIALNVSVWPYHLTILINAAHPYAFTGKDAYECSRTRTELGRTHHAMAVEQTDACGVLQAAQSRIQPFSVQAQTAPANSGATCHLDAGGSAHGIASA